MKDDGLHGIDPQGSYDTYRESIITESTVNTRESELATAASHNLGRDSEALNELTPGGMNDTYKKSKVGKNIKSTIGILPMEEQDASTFNKLTIDRQNAHTRAKMKEKKTREKAKQNKRLFLLIGLFTGLAAISVSCLYFLVLNNENQEVDEAFVPTTSPTKQPTLSPTFSPTIKPTLSPTANPTFSPSFFNTFVFPRKNDIKELCEQTLDPDSLSAGDVFFVSCNGKDLLICEDTSGDERANLDEKSCEDVCSCTDLILLQPQTTDVLEEFCGADGEKNNNCANLLPSVRFIDNGNFSNFTLDIDDDECIFQSMDDECEDDSDSQVCLLSRLRISCSGSQDDIDIKDCSGDDTCDCSLNSIVKSSDSICGLFSDNPDVVIDGCIEE